MSKLVLVYDLDYTIFNSDSRKVEWMGGKTCWIKACSELRDYAEQQGVTLYFAIATAKQVVDDLAAAAAVELHPFLLMKDMKLDAFKSIYVPPKPNHPQLKKPSFVAFHEPSKSVLFAELFGNETFRVSENRFISSFQIDARDSLKVGLMNNIARLFEIEDASRITLVDDSDLVRDAVAEKGYSVISSEHLAQESDKDRRDHLARIFVQDIVRRLKDKILEVAPAKAQSPTPEEELQEHLQSAGLLRSVGIYKSRSKSESFFECVQDHSADESYVRPRSH